MSDPYIGQIEVFAFDFAPKGWALCDRRLMLISQNQALFSVIGTTFGGDGIKNFALPDLRGRTPIGQGNGLGLTPRLVGDAMGEENHTMTINEMPYHNHGLGVLYNPDLAKNTYMPDNTVVLAKATGMDKSGNPLVMTPYVNESAPAAAMSPTAISQAGGAPHPNMMPYLTLNVCISLTGPIPPEG